MPKNINARNSHLLPGLFKERSDVNRAYLMELKTENLVQNFLLEAGVLLSDIHSTINRNRGNRGRKNGTGV